MHVGEIRLTHAVNLLMKHLIVHTTSTICTHTKCDTDRNFIGNHNSQLFKAKNRFQFVCLRFVCVSYSYAQYKRILARYD